MDELGFETEFRRALVQRNIEGKGTDELPSADAAAAAEEEDGAGKGKGKGKDESGVWENVKRRYYFSKEYFLPVCCRPQQEGNRGGVSGGSGGGSGGFM